MIHLAETCPSVEQMFKQGCFVVRKTQRLFYGLSIDHAHEQNNKQVKGDGGAVGLTESSIQLLRWMMSGPEVSRVIADFELAQGVIRNNQKNDPDSLHHEQVHSVQKTFQTQVKALVEVLETMGNPFVETSSDILVLDTKEIANEVVETVMGIEKA